VACKMPSALQDAQCLAKCSVPCTNARCWCLLVSIQLLAPPDSAVMRLDLAPLFSPANRGLRLPPPVMALPLQLPKPLDFSSFLSEAASSSPLAASRSRSEFKLRAVEDSDVNELAVLCTDSFFGTHELADGPIIFMQRLQILLRVRKQLARRIGFEDDDRECRLVVAEDARSGRIVGCLDLAVHLYDRDQERFYLTIEVMPETPGGPLGPFERNKYAWRSYLASYPDPDPDPDPNPDPDPGPNPNPNPNPNQAIPRVGSGGQGRPAARRGAQAVGGGGAGK
jgi:hypothetical protein